MFGGCAWTRYQPGRGQWSTAARVGRSGWASCTIDGMDTPQGGIFALGTASHAYLEFDLRSAPDGAALVRGISALHESPPTTVDP
jgi:hypothetical protein